MGAVLKDLLTLVPMASKHLEAVVAVETLAYEFPWSRSNFVDSLGAGHVAQVLLGDHAEMLGYLLALRGYQEMHLLNLTVAPEFQGRGHACHMLEWLVASSRQAGAQQLWLEVRESNARARHVYQCFGFAHIGTRKGYYPAAQSRREDAVVMSLPIPPAQTESHDAVE